MATAAPARPSLLVLGALLLLGPGCPGCIDDGNAFAQLEVGAEVTPDRVDFGTLFGGRSATRVVRITSTGRSPTSLIAASVTSASGPAFASASFEADELPPGAEVRVEVRITAMASSTGLFVGTLRLSLSGLDAVEVPITAEVRPVPPCDDDNPCTEDRFEDGACLHQVVTDGMACDDENACTYDTVCAGGQCLGRALTCADQLDCTIDTCNPAFGCDFVPSHSACDDGDSCTSDQCVAPFGCQSTPEPVGTVCHFDGCAEIGICSVFGVCDVMPVPNDFPCEDGDPCTTGDSCQEGECTAGETQEVGPTSPVVLAEGGVVTDTGLGWALSGLLLDTEVEEVLDVRRDVAGGLKVVWRGEFRDGQTGDTCVPLYQQDPFGLVVQPVPPLPPLPGDDVDEDDDEDDPTRKLFIPPDAGPGDDDNAGAPREEPPPEPPPPPEPAGCVAGVFLTRLQPSPGAVPSTVQLTVTRGPAAAAITPPHPFGQDPVLAQGHTARVLVASTDERGFAVHLDLYDGGGDRERTFVLYRAGAGDALNPFARLALARHETRAVLVGHSVLRDLYVTCDDFCESGDPACCTGPQIEGWLIDLATGTPEPRSLRVAHDVTACPDVLPGLEQAPWVMEDFKLSMDPLDGTAELGFRMNPSPCIDVFTPDAVSRVPFFYRFDATQTAWEGMSPLPVNPVFGLHHVEQMEHEFVTSRAAAVVELTTCDADGLQPPPEDGGVPMPPPCDETGMTGVACLPEPACAERIVGWLNLDGEVALQDALLGPLDLGLSVQALPLLVEYQSRLATRVGQHVQVTWREEDGAVREVHGAPLGSDTWWLNAIPLRGGDGFVAGVATKSTLEDCCAADGLVDEEGDPIDCGCAGTVVVNTRQLVAQGFECGIEAPPAAAGCLVDADCQGGAVCAYHEELCLGLDCDQHPGICAGDEVPCGGACVDIAEQCSDFSDPCVAPPGLGVPHCPLGAALATASCSWFCVDPVTCAPIDAVPAPDAGPEDAGPEDAGPPDGGWPEPDAGAADAGAADAGAADAGAADAGAADAGQPALDAGLTDGGI